MKKIRELKKICEGLEEKEIIMTYEYMLTRRINIFIDDYCYDEEQGIIEEEENQEVDNLVEWLNNNASDKKEYSTGIIYTIDNYEIYVTYTSLDY